jgi:hypothetical protein
VSGSESASCSSLAAAALDAFVGSVGGGFAGGGAGGGIGIACRLWSSLDLIVDGSGLLLGLDLGSGGRGGCGGVGVGVLLPAVDGCCDGGCCRLIPLGSGGAGGKKGFGGGGAGGGTDGMGFVDIVSRVVDIACRVVGIECVVDCISVSLYMSSSPGSASIGSSRRSGVCLRACFRPVLLDMNCTQHISFHEQLLSKSVSRCFRFTGCVAECSSVRYNCGLLGGHHMSRHSSKPSNAFKNDTPRLTLAPKQCSKPSSSLATNRTAL